MKIAKRISILVFLAVCLFAVERNNIIEAHSSCPERDQCYDTAYANYTECINDANFDYMGCGQDTNDFYHQCVTFAQQDRTECERDANDNLQNRYQSCDSGYALEDFWGWYSCIQIAEFINELNYDICDSMYDIDFDSCNDGRIQRSATCSANFYNSAYQCETARIAVYGICDQLCNRIDK